MLRRKYPYVENERINYDLDVTSEFHNMKMISTFVNLCGSLRQYSHKFTNNYMQQATASFSQKTCTGALSH